MNEEGRGPWYLLTGLAVGLVIGLLYAWLLNPVEFTDTNPASLYPEYKAQYRSLIALAYRADGDLDRNWARLALLKDSSPVTALLDQAAAAQKSNRPAREVEALQKLAADLGQKPEAQATPDPANGTPQAASSQPVASLGPSPTLAQAQMILTPTATPLVTFTPRPFATTRPILRASFVKADIQPVCNPDLPEGLLQIDVVDSSGAPVPGIKAVVTWDQGEDTFFTGLDTDIGPGYADYVMQPGKTYSLKVGEGSPLVSDLAAQKCQPAAGKDSTTPTPDASYWGGWKIRFKQQ